MRIERVPVAHPDAVDLIARVQQEYVERYGGPDETPLDPDAFEDPYGCFFIGYDDGGRAAVSGAWRRRTPPPDVPGTVAAEMKRVYVVPAARGRGLARLMLAHLEDTARIAGADVMVLETGIHQPEAMALYESSGYTPVTPFGHYAAEPECRCYARLLG